MANQGKIHAYLSIRPSKAVVDIHTIIEDVSQFLSPAESLMDVTSSVEVFQGIDPAPLEVLGPNAIYIQGNNIIQQIQAGLPGVVYNILLFGTTNFGNIIEVTVRQAVLPLEVGTFIFPAQLGIFTSPLYPYQFINSIQLSHNLTGGRLFGLITQIAPETFSLTHELLAGELREPLHITSFLETLSLTHTIISGDLISSTKITSFTESLALLHTIQGGQLLTLLIIYANWPLETLTLSHNVTGGNLT